MTKIREIKLTDYIIHNKNNFLFKSILFIFIYSVLFFLIIFQPQIKIFTPNEGDVINEDIIADKDIKYIDKEATKQNEEIIKLTTPPVYIFDPSISENRWRDILLILNKVNDSDNFKDLLNFSKEKNFILNPNEYNFLKKISNEEYRNFIKVLECIFYDISKDGIIFVKIEDKKNIESTGLIIGKYEDNNFIETLYSMEDLNDMNKIDSKIKKYIEIRFSNNDLIERGI
ncbi:MAG TPA: hypothetical protein PK771_16325, partial [Spirochaetota bacterium]|nr:hypothetical protein [Spirochaetota bacterium]